MLKPEFKPGAIKDVLKIMRISRIFKTVMWGIAIVTILYGIYFNIVAFIEAGNIII